MNEFAQIFENFNYADLAIIGGFGIAFLITWYAIPTVVNVAHAKLLYDVPNGRTSHVKATPMLGGIAIFAGLVLATILFSIDGFGQELKYIIGGLTILFFFGIKDDILVLDPKKKLAAQIVAALIVAVLGDIRITNLHGFIGIHEIDYIYSICFSVFLFIVITNGFNLIDGIDGLASGIGIVTSLTFGLWFALSGHVSYGVMCFALTGALSAFFYYNVFSKKNKIFLGDTGSLILGLAMAIFTIRFMEYEVHATGSFKVASLPAVTFGILIIPMFDTLRVFTLRILQGRSPLSADRQHIHHRLLDMEFSHIQVTLIMLGINLFFIVMSISLQFIGNIYLILIQMTIALSASYMMMRVLRKKYNLDHRVEHAEGPRLVKEPGTKNDGNDESCPIKATECPFLLQLEKAKEKIHVG